MKRVNRIVALAAFLASLNCLLVLSGCISASSAKSQDPAQIQSLEPAALLKFPDLPVPSSFRIIPEESYAFQSTNFRACLLKYRGNAKGEQTVNFFKEQMPMYNWHLVNIVEYGSRQLNLEKEQETCIITINEKGNKSIVVISVAPKSQIAPSRKTDKPIK